MKKISPTLGIGAGLAEVTLAFRRVTTAEAFGKFPTPSTYKQILAEREQRAQARTPLGQRLTLLLYLRRRQLVRFAEFCRDTGRPLDEAAWLFSMAWTVKALSGWVMVQFRGMREPQKHWHPVLSRKELRRWTYQAGLHHITDVQLQQAEIAVSRAPCQAMPDALQGRLLRITAAERDCCRFWTSVAIDETIEQRRERKAMEKRARDKKRKAALDEAERQSGKRMSRKAYEAQAAQRSEILKATMAAYGKSRRTVYGWLKKGDPRAEVLRDFDKAAGNCTSVVADIERSSTLTESPIIERPHLCNPVDGAHCAADEGFDLSRLAFLEQESDTAPLARTEPEEALNQCKAERSKAQQRLESLCELSSESGKRDSRHALSRVPARTDRQTRGVGAGVASQPGPVSLNPEPQDVRPRPSWAADELRVGLDRKSSPEIVAPGSKRLAVETPPTTDALQLSLFEALPEERYLQPSDLQSFRRQRDYTLVEISRWARIRNRSCLARFERGQRGLGRHHQRALKYFMETRGLAA